MNKFFKWMKVNHRKVFGYGFLATFFLMVLFSEEVSNQLVVYLVGSFLLLFLVFWCFDKLNKFMSAVVLSFVISCTGVIIITLNWVLIEKELPNLIKLLITTNTGQFIHLMLERYKIFGKIKKVY